MYLFVFKIALITPKTFIVDILGHFQEIVSWKVVFWTDNFIALILNALITYEKLKIEKHCTE